MPEGDTIYRTARALQKALGGRVVTAFETGVAKLASVNDDKPVVGRALERVEARGKWCLIYFSDDLILATHMLMNGSWHIYRVGEKWRLPRREMRVMLRVGAAEGQIANPTHGAIEQRHEWGTRQSTARTHAMKPREWGTRGVADIAGFEAVLFNAQVAEFHTARSLERSAQVPKLGPDVLSSEFTVERGVAGMREYGAAHPEAEVAVVLLNQRVLAGLGNVYKSEVAFAAGVNPFRQMRTVTACEMERMVEFAQRYMRANVADGSSEAIVTYAGNRRTTRNMSAGDRLWVYGRQGEECRRCGATVMMRKQGAAVRSTYWCPVCQPWVAAEAQSEAAPVGKTEKLAGVRRKASC